MKFIKDSLIYDLARELVFFQRSHRSDGWHIGSDMELCSRGGFFRGEAPVDHCSPRCHSSGLLY